MNPQTDNHPQVTTPLRALSPKMMEALKAIVLGSGDDINFVLAYLSDQKHSYVSKLKRKGLAYTYRSGNTIEVWPTDKGILMVQGSEVRAGLASTATEQPKS